MQPLVGQSVNQEREDGDEDDDVNMDDDEGLISDASACLRESREEEPPSFVFFDFETRQELEVGHNEMAIFQHEPNLCIVHIVCDLCRSQPLGHCVKCGPNHKMFDGNNCLDEFCRWLFGNTKKHLIAIAHNAKGFDGQFILKYLMKSGVQPKIINKGLELMTLSVNKVKVIDSLNFVPMPLSALPKAFGAEELAKGWFPHLFNILANQNYIGPWPAAHFYSPDSMKESSRKSFFDWYEKQKELIFDFRKEIFKYCESDVDILCRCVLKFRDIFMSKTGVDPFLNSLTIAGACNRVFRQLFLKENLIGIVPHGGYRRNEKQSIIALKWLKWLTHRDSIEITHSRNMGEFQIGPYKVDGIHRQTVFEFHGCYWHGCPKCMKIRCRPTADATITAQEAYERTLKQTKFIESQGFTVVEQWECDIYRKLKQNVEMKHFFDSIQNVEPLNPHDAFFGGRTNAVKLYHMVKTNPTGNPLERIDYSDICSLYPFVCKYGKFPLGHPKIITEQFEEMSAMHRPYEGLIKCSILAPRRLLHPLLPFRCNNKLTFPLCRTCVEEQQTTPCEHSVDQRALDGAWVSLEVYKALELGYRILKVHEVWHYERVEQFDRETNPTGGLFSDYINTFIKMKQQADGWPSWVNSDRDKNKYINDYFEREFVQLDKNEIVKNPGLRALSKLMLNSFWGKFGQRNNMAKMEFFTQPAEYFKHVFETGRTVHSVIFISDKMVAVTSTMEDEFVEVMGNTNAVIAAYTTAQARLKLYSYIEQLDDRLLYFDTDSIIYTSTIGKDEYHVPTGSYLGDMTDELKDYGPGAYVEEFVSGGPKNYAYKVWSPRDNKHSFCIKVRGFSLNFNTRDIVNFDQLKMMVHKFVREKSIVNAPVNFSRIERTKAHDLVTKLCSKKYRIAYDKRIVTADFCTFPYGWF